MKTNRIHYQTVTPLLIKILQDMMTEPLFDPFRLVGGTAVSLQRGHRKSEDIDLFTDSEYRSIDFVEIYKYFKSKYEYVDVFKPYEIPGTGSGFFIGASKTQCIKVDLYYHDTFINDVLIRDSIRFAKMDDLVAMKMDVINRIGRKKDFWDIHELVEDYTYCQMADLHKCMYPYEHDFERLKKNFTNFTKADEEFDPICLRGKYWELIKLDLLDFMEA